MMAYGKGKWEQRSEAGMAGLRSANRELSKETSTRVQEE
jgi:hypothetical protein